MRVIYFLAHLNDPVAHAFTNRSHVNPLKGELENEPHNRILMHEGLHTTAVYGNGDTD